MYKTIESASVQSQPERVMSRDSLEQQTVGHVNNNLITDNRSGLPPTAAKQSRMMPTKDNLERLIGKDIELDNRLSSNPEDSDKGYMEKQCGVCIVEKNGKYILTLDDHAADSGVWVPYATGKAVIGRSTGSGAGWMASGPFSGCELVVGVDESEDRRVFAAHIAKESGSTGKEEYSKFRSETKASEFYWNKIPMPDYGINCACAYVFVICSPDGIVSMNSLEVVVNKMGGSDGKVLALRTIK